MCGGWIVFGEVGNVLRDRHSCFCLYVTVQVVYGWRRRSERKTDILSEDPRLRSLFKAVASVRSIVTADFCQFSIFIQFSPSVIVLIAFLFANYPKMSTDC